MPEQFYFIHRSPMPGDDGCGAVELMGDGKQTPPYKNAPDIENSIYYYWWLFLRESEQYRICCDHEGRVSGPIAGLYRFFGNIFKQDFRQWWMLTGRELFCESQAPLITVANSGNYRSLIDDVYRNRVIRINYFANEQRLMAELRHLVQTITPYRSVAQQSDSLFPVNDRFHLPSLHRTYQPSLFTEDALAVGSGAGRG